MWLPEPRTLRNQHNRRLPKRCLLTGRVQNCHLAVVLAGWKLTERQTEFERHGLQSVKRQITAFRLPDSGGSDADGYYRRRGGIDLKKRLGQTEQHGLDDQGQGGKMYRNAARILSVDASSTD